MTLKKSYKRIEFINELENLTKKRHPLYKLNKVYRNACILDEDNLNITLSHTSRQILSNNESLRSIRLIFSIVGNISFNNNKRIFSKKSVASFGIQKGNLVGFKVMMTGSDSYDFINKIFIPNINIFTLNKSSGCIKELIIFKEIDKEYDMIVGSFPDLNQLGTRIVFN